MPKIEALILIARSAQHEPVDLDHPGEDRLRHERRRATRSVPLRARRRPLCRHPVRRLEPRFVRWARSRGKLPDAFGRDADGDIERIEHDGAMLPWTLVFSFWIRARWNEWATELRFTRASTVTRPLYTAATPPPSSMRGSSGTLREQRQVHETTTTDTGETR